MYHVYSVRMGSGESEGQPFNFYFVLVIADDDTSCSLLKPCNEGGTQSPLRSEHFEVSWNCEVPPKYELLQTKKDLTAHKLQQILFLFVANQNSKVHNKSSRHTNLQKAQNSTSLSPGAGFTQSFHFSQHVLKPLFKVRLSEGATGLQRGFPYRVPQLLEQHPEKEEHEGQ
ncbi:uncharacterized protein V6R79_016284 [Siganus canaliculatus]